MNPSTRKRLTELNAKLDKTVELDIYVNKEDEPSFLKKAAIGAGTLAAGYGGLSYLRGRMWQNKVLGDRRPTGLSGALGAVRAGHIMNMRTARGAVNSVRKMFAPKVA